MFVSVIFYDLRVRFVTRLLRPPSLEQGASGRGGGCWYVTCCCCEAEYQIIAGCRSAVLKRGRVHDCLEII